VMVADFRRDPGKWGALHVIERVSVADQPVPWVH
jgi:hypothetical protein